MAFVGVIHAKQRCMKSSREWIAFFRPNKLVCFFFDFKSAFNVVHPNLLLNKLEHAYGFDEASSDERYFADRTQAVKIGNSFSERGGIELSVPQGSLLGPLLFLIFINWSRTTSSSFRRVSRRLSNWSTYVGFEA